MEAGGFLIAGCGWIEPVGSQIHRWGNPHPLWRKCVGPDPSLGTLNPLQIDQLRVEGKHRVAPNSLEG